MPKNQSKTSIFRSELGSRILTVLAILSVLTIAILLSGPKPEDFTVDTAEEPQLIVQAGEDPAAKVAELINEPPITSGVIVGTTAILIIIFVGTMLEIRRNP